MNNEQANFIMHAGKKGMKWGVRKSSIPKGAVATVASGGLILGNKKKYTDPKAIALRKEAGRLRSDAIWNSVGSAGFKMIADGKKGASGVGLEIVSALLAVNSVVGATKATIVGVQARAAESDSKSKN